MTHGGWIMELYNFISYFKHKKAATIENSARNCSIHVIEFKCKHTKSKCGNKCKPGLDCIEINILQKNNDNHITDQALQNISALINT